MPSPTRRDSFDAKLDRHRREKKDREKEEKKRLKEMETPEERRVRRIAKKLRKEEHRRALNEDVLPESIPYSDLNNPFGDQNLTKAFVWGKKLEAEGKGGISAKEAEKLARSRIHRNVAEMEELKRNREARMAAREDMEMIAREQDRSQYSDWRRVEDNFHLKQAKLRSKLRLEEGRAKPIDYLARYIAYGNEEEAGKDDELELKEAPSYLKGCSLEDYEDLLADIKVYRVLDGKKNDTFWDDIVTLARGEIKRMESARRRADDVHSTVREDVLKLFKGKSYEELAQIGTQIDAKIRNAGAGVDVAYWEHLLDTLHPFMAKLRLRELHTEKQQIRLSRIKLEQIRETAIHEEELAKDQSVGSTSAAATFAGGQSRPPVGGDGFAEKKKVKRDRPGETLVTKLPFSATEYCALDDEQKEQKWQLLNEGQVEHFTQLLYAQGQYSPRYEEEGQAMPGIEMLDELQDDKYLRTVRSRDQEEGEEIRETGKEQTPQLSAQETRMLEIAKAGMNKDEEVFASEALLDKQTFLWADKYRPRKPKYFNRVHTGFDWNKYNQTHYDIDNPPPKIVQGYRFNIFFPDLLDPSFTPSFKLHECEDKDFAILRFKAGPPYEDIAFKIVNREWEVCHKHGYKCQFQSGVFQLWFFFKRYRYRR